MTYISQRKDFVQMRVEKSGQLRRSVGLEQPLEGGESLWPRRSSGEDQLPFLAAERHKLLVRWNQTDAEYPRDKCFHQLFEAQAERTPQAVAAIFGQDRLTYRQLNRCSGELARSLQALGVGPEVLVGICLRRSLKLLAGTLAILKAGGAYLPLDPPWPQERLREVLEDARPLLLLTERALFGNFEFELPNLNVLCLDASASGSRVTFRFSRLTPHAPRITNHATGPHSARPTPHSALLAAPKQ